MRFLSRLVIALCAAISFSAHAENPGAGAGTSIAGAASQQLIFPQTRLLRQTGKTFYDSLSFTYYFSFLGPSPGGAWGETYNVFREGPAPYQMLHSTNLRYTINPRWSVGATLAAVNDVTQRAKLGSYTVFGNTPADNYQQPYYNLNEREWFNARAYVNLPNWNFPFGYLTTNFAVELPTSNDARLDDLHYGLVLTNALGLFMPSPAWSFGFSSQIIRYFYEDPEFLPFVGATSPTRYQTMLVTVGPYLNYSLSDEWQIASLLAFDWDTKGDEPWDEVNNNLPNRGRLAINRLFRDSILGHIGLYTQFLIDPMKPSTTALGIDFTVRF